MMKKRKKENLEKKKKLICKSWYSRQRLHCISFSYTNSLFFLTKSSKKWKLEAATWSRWKSKATSKRINNTGVIIRSDPKKNSSPLFFRCVCAFAILVGKYRTYLTATGVWANVIKKLQRLFQAEFILRGCHFQYCNLL